MTRLLCALLHLIAALVAAFSIVALAWSFSYPGRLAACEAGLNHYAKKEPQFVRSYCLKNVEVK